MGEGGAQEVERHVSDSSTGPTLTTETDTLIWRRWRKCLGRLFMGTLQVNRFIYTA